MIVTDLQLN